MKVPVTVIVDSDTKNKVEESIASLRKAMEGEDVDEIKRFNEELTQTSHKLAEAMYQQASQNEQQAGAESTEQAAGGAGAADEDVVDADFEEVKDEDQK